MVIRRFLIASVLSVFSMVAAMAQMAIPVDDQVRMGKLDNGLTYYIRHNEWPEHVANFYIAQRVGSIQEEESQRGLAHFLEHMAFNGSEHFPGNGIIDFTRSLGVEFGSDLNAYTSIDQTVYRVCNVPTKRQTALDSCLLILKDWSNGLKLEKKEIVKERDVVHNEWRMGEGPSQRMITRALPKLYPGSKYGLRMPIGLMSVIDNFKRKELVQYYQKWYRPDNQAIIVVGDVDVDHTEAEIKRLFSGIKLAPNAAQVVAEPVPDNNEPILIFEKDLEMPVNQIYVMMKTEAYPDNEKGDINYLMLDYMTDVVCSMLNARLSEAAQEPDCPFVSANSDYGQYILSKPMDNFELSIQPKEGKDMEALKAVMIEARRAAQFGFTGTEYERARADYLASLEKRYTNRDKQTNAFFGDQCRDHFLSNEPLVNIEFLHSTMSAIAPSIPLELVNQAVSELISVKDTNLVVLEFAREAEGLTYPNEAQMKQAIDAARSAQIEAYVDNVKDEPLITEENMPTAGSIKSEKENKQFGYKELTLSNGATVILKKTDFKNDEVRMQAYATGGKSVYGEKDYASLKVFDELVGYSGIGNFTGTELQKALAGKNCNADINLGLTYQYLNANSTPKDLETMFQMSYLYFTALKKDEKQVGNLMSQLELALKNKDLQPTSVLVDTLSYVMNNGNPRFMPVNINDLPSVDYDRVLQIAAERMRNASQFTFIIVGNFEEETIRPLIEQYIASLPTTGEKADKYREVRTMPKGKVKKHFTVETDSPNAYSIIVQTTPLAYTLENSVKLDAAGQLLSQIYLATIREEESAAYTCGASGSFNLSGDQPYAILEGISSGNPDKNARALELLHKGLQDNAVKVDADALAKVKEYMLKQADIDFKSNSNWINIISTWKMRGLDTYTNYKKTVESLTPENMAAFIKQIIDAGNEVELVMTPVAKTK